MTDDVNRKKLRDWFFYNRRHLLLIEKQIEVLRTELQENQQRMTTLAEAAKRNQQGLKEYVSLEIANLPSDNGILIMGFYGARNIGDELMLKTLLDYFDKKGVRATVMMSDNYSFDTSYYAPHKVIHYPRRPDDIAYIVEKFDTFVWGGGATIDDQNYYYNGENTSLAYSAMAISKSAIKNHKKVMVLGVSANRTITDHKFINDLNYVIQGAKFFSLRDENSLKTLKEARVDSEKITIIDDLALSQLDFYNNEKKNNDKLTIGLVYILNDKTINKLSEYTKKLILYLEKNIKEDVEILMIPFYDYLNNDYEMYKKILKEIENTEINQRILVRIIETIDESVSSLLKCDLAFGMRYHAILLASCAGVKTVAIDYSTEHRHYYNKVAYVKKNYNPEILTFKFGEPTEEFEKIIERAFSVKRLDVQEKKEQSKKFAGKMNDLLKNLF